MPELKHKTKPRKKAELQSNSKREKMNTFMCFLSREMQHRQSQCKRRDEVTVLSNVIVHKSKVFACTVNNKDSTTMQSVSIEPKTSTRKSLLKVINAKQEFAWHDGPDSFWKDIPGDKH